jgi:hypothetical protein
MADDLEKYLNSLPDQITGKLSNTIREQADLLSAAQKARLKQLEQSPDETGDLEASWLWCPARTIWNSLSKLAVI